MDAQGLTERKHPIKRHPTVCSNGVVVSRPRTAEMRLVVHALLQRQPRLQVQNYGGVINTEKPPGRCNNRLLYAHVALLGIGVLGRTCSGRDSPLTDSKICNSVWKLVSADTSLIA